MEGNGEEGVPGPMFGTNSLSDIGVMGPADLVELRPPPIEVLCWQMPNALLCQYLRQRAQIIRAFSM